MRLEDRPRVAGAGTDFVWLGEVVGSVVWADGSGPLACGWWLTMPGQPPHALFVAPDGVDLDRVRLEHEPSVTFMAKARVAALLADDLNRRRQNRA